MKKQLKLVALLLGRRMGSGSLVYIRVFCRRLRALRHLEPLGNLEQWPLCRKRAGTTGTYTSQITTSNLAMGACWYIRSTDSYRCDCEMCVVRLLAVSLAEQKPYEGVCPCQVSRSGRLLKSIRSGDHHAEFSFFSHNLPCIYTNVSMKPLSARN